LSRAMRSKLDGSEGFTIIEVLVALAVSAASLAAIGTLMATSLRGARTIEHRVSLQQAARIIATGLPRRSELALGDLDGEIAGYGWRVGVLPFFTDMARQGSTNPWVPRTVAISLRSSSGSVLRINTVRLVRRPEQ
jgi:general secretion pathway protein I